jgi:DNA-nicking Smr family endonuclease
MPAVFGKEERGFYNALFIPDMIKRRSALNKWTKSTISIIQAALPKELEDFIENITEGKWTDEGWKLWEKKLQLIENDYHLVMEIKLRKIYPNEKYRGKLPEPVIRPKIGSDVNIRESISGHIMSKTEIDLHGMRVAEAKLHVDDFLKDCYKTNERVVWIIHGKGTGVLSEEMQKFLKIIHWWNHFQRPLQITVGKGQLKLL